MPQSKASRILRYLRHFGLPAGLQAARLLGRGGRMIAIRLPGMSRRLWARPGTSDVETFEEIFVSREYELRLADFSPSRIIDLGSNVGFASIWFSTRWPDAHILAVEPAAANVAVLHRNLRAWPNIAYLQAAVWPRPATVAIANPNGALNSLRMRESADAETDSVPAFTVGQLIDRQGWDRVDLLKMDVEGAEADILRGDVGWLERVGVLVIELHDRIVPGCAHALYGALAGRRFSQEIIGANLAIDLR